MKKATLTFDSFDGGGPSYSAVLEDPSIVSVAKETKYHKWNHEMLDGSAYDVIFTFTGVKAGRTGLKIEERSPIGGDLDHYYTLTVDANLRVTIEAGDVLDPNETAEAIQPVPTLVLAVGNRTFYAALEDNAAAVEFAERLSTEPITVNLEDSGGFKAACHLPWTLSAEDATAAAVPGDILLCGGDTIAVCCDENTLEFTKLARIEDVTKEDLLSAFGGGVTVTLWVEWSE